MNNITYSLLLFKQTACAPPPPPCCSDSLGDGDWGDPGIYTLMKTIMGKYVNLHGCGWLRQTVLFQKGHMLLWVITYGNRIPLTLKPPRLSVWPEHRAVLYGQWVSHVCHTVFFFSWCCCCCLPPGHSGAHFWKRSWKKHDATFEKKSHLHGYARLKMMLYLCQHWWGAASSV